MHLIGKPITSVLSVITPDVDSESSYLVVDPIALEKASIVPDVMALSILFALGVLAFIPIAIWP